MYAQSAFCILYTQLLQSAFFLSQGVLKTAEQHDPSSMRKGGVWEASWWDVRPSASHLNAADQWLYIEPLPYL